jgi:uncharacterized protein (TIGR03435 family)
MKSTSLAIASTLLSSALLGAQTPGPRFEVASVKVNKSDGPSRILVGPGDRVTINSVSLRTLIQVAYSVSAEQVVAGPNWLDTLRFDVLAKAESPAPSEQLRVMLQNLLAERFGLTIRKETRSRPVLALVVARSDGRLGPNLKPATRDCAALRADSPTGDPCGMQTFVTAAMTGRMAVRGMDLSSFARFSRDAGGPIVNKTGLTGVFDWELTWTPRQELQTPRTQPTIDQNGASIFAALQEQLGLKLEPQREDTDVLVIEKVEQPTEN